MSMPKSIVKINKDGVQYISNVDATMYTIDELTRGALRDVAKMARKDAKKRVHKVSGTLQKNIATWVKKSKTGGAPELQVGVYTTAVAKKKGITPAYHAHLVEFGHKTVSGKDVAANPFLKPSVYENLNQIKEIESKYLSGINYVTETTKFDESEEISDD